MEKEFIYHPKGVCSKEMRITYDGDTITGLTVIGGCPGNLQGIGRLIKGRKMKEVAEALDGTRCGFKNTSCPDQLSKALSELMKEEHIA